MKTIHILIIGKVQGVFYRASAKSKAITLGVNGWVANTSEGKVEMIVTGEPGSIETFIEWCHAGPVAAKVDEVIVNEIPYQVFEGFIIKR